MNSWDVKLNLRELIEEKYRGCCDECQVTFVSNSVTTEMRVRLSGLIGRHAEITLNNKDMNNPITFNYADVLNKIHMMLYYK